MSDPREVPTRPDLWSDQMIDLDIFAGADVVYRVTDAKGTEHKFPVPWDIPWRMGVAFIALHEEMERARFATLNAEATDDEQGRNEAMERFLERRAAAEATLVEILRLRREDVTTEVLAGFGDVAMERWMDTFRMRLFLQHMPPEGQEPVLPKAPEQEPRAAKKPRGRRRSSTSSAA